MTASSRIHYFSLMYFLWCCWLSGSVVVAWTSSPFSTARIHPGRPSTFSSSSSSSPWSIGDGVVASRRRSWLFSSLMEEDEEEEEPVVMAIESLSPSQIVELVELSFLQSVFGMAQGKLEDLQLFIIAVKTASTQQGRVSHLLQSLDELADQRNLVRLGTTTEQEDPAAPRPLDPKERALRSTWIQVIYWLVAYYVSADNTTTIDIKDIDPAITQRYSPDILDDLVAIQKSGLGLNAQAFVERRQEHFFPDVTHNPLLLDEQDAIDPMDKAIVSQTIKVLFYTLLVLADDGETNAATTITDSPSTTTSNSDNNLMESSPESSKTSKKQSKSKTKRSGGRGFGGG